MTGHQHTHGVQPPEGSIFNPGPCRGCGITYPLAQAQQQLAEAVAAVRAAGGGMAEYGLLMSGGGYHVRNTASHVEEIYPTAEWATAEWAAAEIRSGGHVHRRRVVVVDDWEELALADLRRHPGGRP